MNTFDPLWVPVLTHYDAASNLRLDNERTADHLMHISPHVSQFLIAGTTGDGWEMSDEVLMDWIQFAQTPGILSPDHKVLFGAFGPTTEAVIERAKLIEEAIDAKPLSASYAGLTLCAPVAADATQAEIADHFHRILSATRSPIAIYQLPQVVHCSIAPETFSEIASSSTRVTLFKDTSGDDSVATSGVMTGSARLLRGAEGDYVAHLKPNGAYDGWLLSTANGLAPQLRTIAKFVEQGQLAEAVVASDSLSGLAASLFEAAGGLPSGNPFSNANRAVDHILAHGAAWGSASAHLVSGDVLPDDFLQSIEALLQEAGMDTTSGYRAGWTN